MIRSRIAMGFLWALLALAFHVVPGVVAPVHAQGSRKDDIVFNSRGVPLAGATIRVCAMPATGQPCTPLALIYSDAALTQAIANPTASDGLGNYFFFAAPGRYEIEISGPGITTKQIPNIILPSDPSSPTFSGAVSAFSLTLSGNLTVNGNTTVLGNLASGTLNLTNQGTPPGTASAGTVNLYTKTADKRVYYKDETGTEVGPLGPGNGAQTNVSNTFTAQQNIDADFRTKGPNPWYDVSRYGGYANGYPFAPTTTGSITSASTTLTTAGAFDVANGQYVTVYGAGPAATIYTPGAAVPVSTISVTSNVATLSAGTDWACGLGQNITIAGSSDSAFNASFTPVLNLGANVCTFNITHVNCNPCTIGGSTTVVGAPPFITSVQGILNGSTTYNYKIVAEDLFGGLSAASAPITITTGAATLGPNSATVANQGCARDVTGLTTITTTSAHNFQTGVPVLILTGSTGDSSFEGQAIINTTPTSTTFTYYQYGRPVKTNACGGGTVKVVAKNIIRWNQRFNTLIGHWIYRCTGAACSNYTLIGHSDGVDGAFIDYGLSGGLPNAPGYVPQGVPPAAPTNQWLSAKVNSGAGTSTLTLSVAASNTVSGATALHDNTPAILAVCTAMGGATGVGGTIYMPDAGGNVYPITTILDMRPTCPKTIKLLQAGRISTTASLIPQQGMNWEGAPQGSGGASGGFGSKYQAQIIGNAYPQIFQTGSTATAATFENLSVQCVRAYQGCYYQDGTWSQGVFTTFRNFSAGSTPGGFPMRPGGQFFYLYEFVFFTNGAAIGNWGVPEPFIQTNSFGIGNSTQSLVSDMEMRYAEFSGGGILFENNGQVLGTGMNSIKCVHCLLENSITPLFRSNTPNSSSTGQGFHFEYLSFADSSGGGAMPMIDLSNSQGLSDITVHGAGCANGGAPLFAMGANVSAFQSIDVAGTSACGIGAPQAVVSASGSFGQTGVTASGTGSFSFLMSTPAAPTVAISGGVGPAAGTYTYEIIASDLNANNTFASPQSSSITVNGSQGVLVSWTNLPGQASTTICRSTGGGGACASNGSNFQIAGTSYLDNGSGFYTASAPLSATAVTAKLNSAGLIVPNQIQMVAGSAADTITGSFTANRTQTLPDNSGYVPITGYLNSAYDNATRANGAIGSNWTIQQNGLNIASNQIQGTIAAQSNSGFWNANAFSANQFAQATVTALNGTSDFPGVTVLASGTGASSTYYDCVESSTTIFIQRVVNAGTTNLTNTASTGAVGDVLRLEVASGGSLTCYKNGSVALSATDTQITSGSPGLLISGGVATEKNWSGGNLHPLGQLDIEQDWTKTQHFTQGVAFGTESFSASPRAEQNVFLPGALTAIWTGATWTTDKAVTITRFQVQAKTAPAGCTTNAIVRLTDGTTPINVTLSAAANDSGAIAQNYPAGSSLQILVQTAAAGCTTSPADANVTVQYRMQ